jgi:acetylornithine/N-succinyldiaminopimelate aminotransferase
VLDVVTEPGFLDHVRKIALLFRQRLAEIKDRHPAVIAEVRGEGLLIGLKCRVPNGEVIDAFRAEKLLSVGAGDNVARLVPPLIVTEAEVADAIGRVDRACTAIERVQQAARKQGAAG